MSNETDRCYGLDLLRSLAMLLGIFFHAPMFYYIPEMAVISGHKDPRMLFRNTHLRASDLVDKIVATDSLDTLT